ncbi:hypothetical protein ACKWRH_21515 [Bradyrhizobium sp. Pa8]|uniref:hypothetical protein n=1 Tax=Bradyrhizobium sp. Pa8 TaxID=3386552 RepID=UPI00403F485E
MEQATGDPRAQCLLYVIADCANEEGVAWPGADWMAAKSQQSRATVYRRLDLLQASGLLVMFPRWIDDAGKIWSAAAPGRRRTSPEIRLQFGVFIKQVAPSEDQESDDEPAAPLSQAETGVSQRGDGAVSAERQGSSHCSDNNHHLNREEDSPPSPPPGGGSDLEGWKEFESDWGEPILRQSIAQQVWAALSADERSLARRAAQGYAVHLRSQRRPPARLGAHLFLKERDAWEGFAKLAPDAAAAARPASYDPASPEGRAITALYAIARGRPPESRGRIVYPREVTAQLLALDDPAKSPRGIWIEDREQIGAWSKFIATHVPGNRTSLIDSKGMGLEQRRGIYAPHPWPPTQKGEWPPPKRLMTDQDYQDLKS